MRFGRAFAAALATLAASAGAAAAQGPNTSLPTSGQTQVLYSVSPEEVSSIITARNRVVVQDTAPNGGPGATLRVYTNAEQQAARNPYYNVRVTACDTAGRPRGCLGLHMFRVASLQPQDMERMRRFADAFHKRFSFARVYPVEANGRSMLTLDYYTMVDDGVTRRHLDRVINEWEGIIAEFLKLWNETR